jgi:hypothetical protein
MDSFPQPKAADKCLGVGACQAAWRQLSQLLWNFLRPANINNQYVHGITISFGSVPQVPRLIEGLSLSM